MTEHESVRLIADNVGRLMPGNHPCRDLKGECCEITDIAVTVDDRQLIIEAFKRGDIERAIIARAVSNASDPDRAFCPFFDNDSKLCMIYKERPIPCQMHGAGLLMCQSCQDCMKESGYIPSSKVVFMMGDIEAYVLRHEPKDMLKFVQEDLSPLLV